MDSYDFDAQEQITNEDQARSVGVVDRSADRVLSAVAHGAIVFGLFGVSFLITLAISGVIWLYSRRSSEVRFHSGQAGCYQCSVLLINVLLVTVAAVTGVFSIFSLSRGQSDWGAGWGSLIGLTLFILWFGGSILYGLFAAVMVLLGKEFKYPIIGDRFERDR
ncbi:MAG: DUF4870 domain-containing protein [Chloroflexota bacterium]|nr:DUF4870 domain-containing protein [Chloroflexota bacterium]